MFSSSIIRKRKHFTESEVNLQIIFSIFNRSYDLLLSKAVAHMKLT